MNNLQRITLASFLAYFVMSGMLAPIGIISTPMAAALDLSVTDTTAGFSWLTFGILGGAIAALFVFDVFALKRIIVALAAAIAVCLAVIRWGGSAALIWPALGLIGVACGISLAAAALTISQSYEPARRASMLVVTDGAFSVAGILFSALAVFAVSAGWHWASTYACLIVVTLLIVGFAAVSQYPEQRSATNDEKNERWPAAVWCCVLALFLYTLGQYAMLWWLPNHLSTTLGIAPDMAGGVVGRFWTGMFVAQLFVAWWVLKTGARRLSLIAGIATLLGSIPLWIVTDIDLLLILAAVWGFANLGLLKVVLSFATEQVAVPPPRLVSMMLLGATLGTAVSPWLSSRIVAASDTMQVLKFSSGCYLAMCVLLFAANALRKKESRNEQT